MDVGKKGLKKREKILIFLVGTVGLVLIVYMYVITPLNEQIEAKTQERDALSQQWRVIEAGLRSEAEIRELRDDGLERYETIRDMHISESLNQEIGREMTYLVRDHNFREVNQSLSGVASFTEGGIEDDAYFSFMPITMTIDGEFEDLTWMLDTFEYDTSVSITRFGLSFSEEFDYERRDLIEMSSISLGFRVIMIRDEQFEEAYADIRYVEEEESE